MGQAVIDTVERTLPDLKATAASLDKGNPRGSLRLDPDLEIPAYHTAVDIHLQPGAYHSEFTDSDVAAGAIYDRAIYLYLGGATGRRRTTCWAGYSSISSKKILLNAR